LDRPIGDEDNGWTGDIGSWITYTFEQPERVREVRFVFDSDLNRPEKNMPAHYTLEMPLVGVPETLVRAFRVEALGADGNWRVLAQREDNHQRLVRLAVDTKAKALRFVPVATWGVGRVHLFAWDVQ
jgi:hypothetical protein